MTAKEKKPREQQEVKLINEKSFYISSNILIDEKRMTSYRSESPISSMINKLYGVYI